MAMIPSVLPCPENGFDLEVETLIIGAGACGLTAALAAQEAGQEVLVVEADAIPSGSTALSAGLIPAAGTHLQHQAGISDSPALFAADIQKKADQENDPRLVHTLAENSATVIHWLMERFDLPFTLVDDFDYPGHSRRRMHGLPTRSGLELINALRSACEAQHIPIVGNRRAWCIHINKEQITGVTVSDDRQHPESIACRKLILACNGFGGNRSMVRQYLPRVSEAVWFGHDGNRGEAVQWGQALKAAVRHLGAFQGHGNVAHPHGILITWAVIMQGGIQLNSQGKRFWNESQGYSEAAVAVLSQPQGVAITVFDERIAVIARQFEDFKQAEEAGAIQCVTSARELALAFQLPEDQVRATLDSLPEQGQPDQFGRVFYHPALQPPLYGVRVTAALFHTQGGLVVDDDGRVLKANGGVIPRLFAGGGAACGVSGSADHGYLSGNGLLSAIVLGYRAGLARVP